MHFEKPLISDILPKLSSDFLNVLYIGERCSVDIPELLAVCAKNHIRIAGGIFPGIIYDNEHANDDAILLHWPLTSQCIVFNSNNNQLPVLSDNVTSAAIWVDGCIVDIPALLQKIYSKYGGSINYYGGGCGTSDRVKKPCLFTDEGFVDDSVLVIFNEKPVQLGVKHGWKKIAGPFLVSNSNLNVVHSLNWDSAFNVYKNSIRKTTDELITEQNFHDISRAFPFGIFREGMEDVIRTPMHIGEKNSLICIGLVNKNSSLNILCGKNNDLIESAGEAAKIAAKDIEPESVFVIDCISRVLYLGNDFYQELNAVKNQIGYNSADIVTEGVLSLGEISSYGDGYIEFFNKTIVVSILYTS